MQGYKKEIMTSLKSKTLAGFIWNSIGSLGSGLMNFVVTMILARLLSPNDFGLLELLIIFTSLSNVFVDSGFSQALIRDRGAESKDFSTVFFFNMVISFSIYTFLFFISPKISVFFGSPELVNLSRFVFLTIVFNSLSLVQNVIFSRNLDFKRPALATTISVVFAGIISILLAYNGFGVWALAFNIVLFSFFNMLMLWILSAWKPKAAFSTSSLKKYFKFGGNLLVQGLTDKVVTNLESFCIGKIYTKSDLGYFSQARKLDSYLTQSLVAVVQRVTYPALSHISDNIIRLKSGYRQVVGLTMYIITPVISFVFFSADNFLYVVFGSQWLPTVPYLRLWLICGLAVTLYSIFINAFLVVGDSKKLLKVSLARQIIRVIVVLLLVNKGIIPLLYGIVTVTVLFGIIYIYIGGRLINYSFYEVMKDLYKIFVASFSSAYMVTVITNIFLINGIYFRFLVQISLMSLLYLIISFLLKDKYQIECLSLIKSVLTKFIKKK